MRKVYYLSTCDTCKRIISDLDLKSKNFEFQDIKKEAITADQIDHMKSLSGSFESLFSRIARKYKILGLKDQVLAESDYRNYILEEYTFLKRPVIIVDNQIFVGNSKKNVEAARDFIG